MKWVYRYLKRKEYVEEISVENIRDYLGKWIVFCERTQENIRKILERRESLAEDFVAAYREKIRDPVFFREIKSLEFETLRREENDISQLLLSEGLFEGTLIALANKLKGDRKRFIDWHHGIRAKYPYPSVQQDDIIFLIRMNFADLALLSNNMFDKLLRQIGICIHHEKDAKKLEKILADLLKYKNVVKILDSGSIKRWEAKRNMNVEQLKERLEHENTSFGELNHILGQLAGAFTDLKTLVERMIATGPPVLEKTKGIRINLIGNLTAEQTKALSEEGKRMLLDKIMAMPITKVYLSLANEPWFIESFQMGGKYHNMKPVPIEDVYRLINQAFGTNHNDQNRAGFGGVYVALIKKDSVGILYSYGEAHTDAAQRPNEHHFVVHGNYDVLQKALQSFIENPGNLKDFVNLAFGWRNEQEKLMNHGRFGAGSQNDLFEKMKKLIIYSEETGIREIAVSEVPAAENQVEAFLDEFLRRFLRAQTSRELQEAYEYNSTVGGQVLPSEYIYTFLNRIMSYTLSGLSSRSADEFDKALLTLTSRDPRELEAHGINRNSIYERAEFPSNFIQQLVRKIQELKERNAGRAAEREAEQRTPVREVEVVEPPSRIETGPRTPRTPIHSDQITITIDPSRDSYELGETITIKAEINLQMPREGFTYLLFVRREGDIYNPVRLGAGQSARTISKEIQIGNYIGGAGFYEIGVILQNLSQVLYELITIEIA